MSRRHDDDYMDDRDRPKTRKGRGFAAKSDERDYRDRDYDTLEATSSGNALRSVEGWVIFVGNVHEEATEEDVKDYFCEFGEIKNLHLNLDRRTGFVKGYALIEYADVKEARDAIDEADGRDLLGNKMSVDWAFVRAPRNR